MVGFAPNVPDVRLSARTRMAVMAAGHFSVLVGITTLIGWTFDISALKDWAGSGFTMKTNAALCAVCAGVCVPALTLGRDRLPWIALTRALGLLCVLLGLLTLLEHALGWNLWIHSLLFTASEPPHFMGRMGLPASIAFVMPAVAVTAFARAEDRVRSLSAGYSMHVSKPFEPQELVTVISTLTRHTSNIGSLVRA